MNISINKDDLGLFFKTGIVVLSVIAVIFSSTRYLPRAVTVTNHTNSTKVPINSVDTDKKLVSLTFDIDNDDGDLMKILDILDNHNVKATFFITGKWLDNNYEQLNKIIAGGHDIGNHSNNHKHMDLLSEKECREEISSLHNKVKKSTGIDMTLFRSPYGDYNNTVIHTAKELGYETIKGDIDSLDWKDYSKEDIIRKATDNKTLKNGSILLFHTGAKFTADSLDEVIIGLKYLGYDLIPISELILDPLGVKSQGSTKPLHGVMLLYPYI